MACFVASGGGVQLSECTGTDKQATYQFDQELDE